MRESWFCILFILVGCGNENVSKVIRLKNSLPIARQEVVSIPLDDVSGDTTLHDRLVVMDGDSTLVTQLYDSNYDGTSDQLLIYVSIDSNQEKVLQLTTAKNPTKHESTFVFSRFVPERIDDYAWENDRVAFRMYGPEAQRLVEESQPGGTLSSGIDCWLKRVDYPIINNWYQKYVDGGSYHNDTGEGYDPYHVGASLGCGGLAVRSNDSLFVSKNFVSWKKIAEGPLRNTFELTYAPWQVGEVVIHETKRISIDAGSQLTLVEEEIKTSAALPFFTIGVTLHEGRGQTLVDSPYGAFGYWEKIDDAFLGTGIVIPPDDILAFEEFRSAEKDKSHLFVNIRAKNNVKYYTGFAWEKAGKIVSVDQWRDYLVTFSKTLNDPIETSVE